jgi:hypothetical protein
MMGDPMDMSGHEYGDEMDGDMENGHMMHDMEDMDQEQYEDQSLNFDDNPEFRDLPPLDKLRKIRRDIINTINDKRKYFDAPGIYQDNFSNKAANDYAAYLLSNEESDDVIKECLEKNFVIGNVKALIGTAFLEEDENEQEVMYDEYMDAHGLLLELEEETAALVNAKITHIGVGFAHNKERVIVVEFISEKPLMISELTSSEDD